MAVKLIEVTLQVKIVLVGDVIAALGVAGCDPIVPNVAVEIHPELFFAVIL